MASDRTRLGVYQAWDVPTRAFHWINAILVIGLLVLGGAMLAGGWFGVGEVGRERLQQIHLVLGAALVLNLLWRGYWAFRGNRFAQWRSVLPGGSGYWRDLRAYLSAFVAGHPQYYIGHNPLARLGVAVLLLLLTVQIVSGLLLLGVNAFAPPPEHLLGPRSDVSALAPRLPWAIPWSAADAEALRAPLRAIHLYGFYLLAIAIVQHIAAVVATEFREGSNLVSAMLTGWKSFPGHPRDEKTRHHGRNRRS
jgi:Ni/Fe-hydrogenase 1 B-type cytochrome subunit